MGLGKEEGVCAVHQCVPLWTTITLFYLVFQRPFGTLNDSGSCSPSFCGLLPDFKIVISVTLYFGTG